MSSRAAVLTIAGSDSGGGAGIQADLKTFAAHGVHGASAITAITAQNSRSVDAVEVLSPALVAAQIDAVMRDLRPEVVKLGMLGNAAIVECVIERLEKWKPAAIVLDPVMVASTGSVLLEDDAIDLLRERLLPMATITTPNWLEAGVLINAQPRGLHDLERIWISFHRLGAKALLVKGGHVEGEEVVDSFYTPDESRQFTSRRIPNLQSHGTGCTLAAALAAELARGADLASASALAVAFVQRALAGRYAVGESRAVFLAIET